MLSNLPPANSEARQAAGSDNTVPAAQAQPAVSAFATLLQAAQPPADVLSAAADASMTETASDAAADSDGDGDNAVDGAAAKLALLGAGLLPLQLPSQALPPPQADTNAAQAEGSRDAVGVSTATAPRAAAESQAPMPAAINNSRSDDASGSVAANLAAPRTGHPQVTPRAAAEQLAAQLLAAGSRQDSAGEGSNDGSALAAVAQPMSGSVATAQPAAAQWAPLKLPASQPAQWGQVLQQALGERLRVQAGNGIDNAVIRLDPPHLGSLEIAIRHEAGSLQVQLSAGNGELLRQLHAISDSLRQGLGNRQYGEVAVWVADSRQQHTGQGGQGRQGEPREQRPGQALYEAEQGYAQAAFTLA